VQPFKNPPTFYGTRRFNTVFTIALHWSLSRKMRQVFDEVFADIGMMFQIASVLVIRDTETYG
jgi:hypothetical protein